MAKRYPREPRDDVVRVARRRNAPIAQIAKDFGISDATLYEWMKKADVEDGVREGMNEADAAAMGELSRQLLYKAQWHGVEVRVVDRFFPSSKTCSGCGELKSDFDLSTRTYSCDVCGLVIGRDLNAAINLARWQPKEPATVTLLASTRAPLLSAA